MFDAAVKIADKLIQLLSLRERNREKYFENFVEPLFHDAEIVFKDYIALITELIRRLNEEDDVSAVITWLEERRLELLPVRIKLRSMVARGIGIRRDGIGHLFEHGIVCLMRGGLSIVEEGYMPQDYSRLPVHTALDLLYGMSHQPLAAHRGMYIGQAEQQLEYLERAWRQVTDGYSELRYAFLA